MLVDIDLFKEVNDRFGHEAGDEVLSVVAGRLRAGVRAVDLAGRWCGDEFLIVSWHPFAALGRAQAQSGQR